ncbi:MAG: hypothetical protein ABSA21_09910 [Candidatus Limnocylindrales bacterium]|jgi:hypothetical protein
MSSALAADHAPAPRRLFGTLAAHLRHGRRRKLADVHLTGDLGAKMPVGRLGLGWTGGRARAGNWVVLLVMVGAAVLAGGCSSPVAPSYSLAASQALPSSAPAGTPTMAASPSATPVDADDEAGASSPPGASFSPGPTGAPIGSIAPGSAADRLPGEPDPALTPGALNPAVTQATIGSTICVSGWTATIRPPSNYTTGLKIRQIVQYGYTDTSTSDYEEDHLISLELGGAPTDPRNLWPEPYAASLADGRPTGAHTKDGFETRLKNQVCAGAITLAQAQSEIGDHWVHAYYGIQLGSGTSSAGTPAAGASATGVASAVPGTSNWPGASAGAGLSVSITSLPASIKHGASATLVAVTSPGATCSASVTYASGTVSSAAGLKPQPTAGSTGKVSWTWKVGTSTKPGTSTATVSCSLDGEFGSASKTFQVT